ncbi:MAG: FecCD family ABC transporter permease [Lentisphaeria bacterium]
MSNKSVFIIWLGIVFFTLALLPLALLTGPAELTIGDIWECLLSGGQENDALIVWHIRLPRIVLAWLVGAGLALAGVVFQGLLTNPLAGPYTLGISSGAAFGASIAILLSLTAWTLPFLALTGAAVTLALVLLLSGNRDELESRNLILAGIVVGSIFSAAISLIKTISGDSLSSIVFWIMGSLAGRGWEEVNLVLPYFVVGVSGLLIMARDLDLLSLGAEHANSAGVEVKHSRRLLIFFASMLAAAVVAVSGVIGFVGLIVPHALRMLIGPAHRRLSVLAVFTGGLLLLAADTLARVLSYAGEIPVGVITALFGGPFFCYLLVRSRSRC